MISARYNVTKDIANGVGHQKDIFYEGLQLMQKNDKVHRDIERLYHIFHFHVKTCKIAASCFSFFNFRFLFFSIYFFLFICFF